MKSLFQTCSSRREEAQLLPIADYRLPILKSEPRYLGCYFLNLSPCI
jgi:hypothetical protein